MSNGTALSSVEKERVPEDAARLFQHVRDTAQHDKRGIRVRVSTRSILAAELDITMRQVGRAEAYLLAQKKITVTRLTPRNEREAARRPVYLYRLTERSAA